MMEKFVCGRITEIVFSKDVSSLHCGVSKRSLPEEFPNILPQSLRYFLKGYFYRWWIF
jgi:hypothetical protein